LRDPNLTEHLKRTLESNGVAPGTLTLEITETAIPGDDPEIAGTLANLDALGVRLCLDDFGTGYSSLGVLRNYPIGIIKIDRSFLVRASDTVDDFQLLQGITNLGQTLNKEVIVEGVETADQLQHVQALRCGFAQGEYFGQPMSGDEVERFLARQSEQGPGGKATRSACP
jgi:EAL domain-containing protein (putative c-di-GMP-specific phosphodiesterase class I)